MSISSAQPSYSITLNNPSTSNVTLSTTIPYTYSTGSTLTSNGITTSWVQPNNNFVSNNGKAVMTIPADKQEVVLEKDAALVVKGTVKINGIDLEERLKTIERVLMIPERDATMEAKYPSLKKKFDEYINTLEKYKTFERIKGEE